MSPGEIAGQISQSIESEADGTALKRKGSMNSSTYLPQSFENADVADNNSLLGDRNN